MQKKLKCVHCGEVIEPWHCDICKRGQASSCKECHNELAHGEIPPAEHITDGRDGIESSHATHETQYRGDALEDGGYTMI